MHIVATNGTNLSSITLSGNSNTRKVYVNRSGGNLTLNTSGYTNGPWWLGLSLSNTPMLTVVTPTNGTLNVVGGLRTDGNITVSPTSGTLTNTLETSPGNAEYVTDRVLWIEEVRSQ
jgi:hypothetical protein